MVYNSLVHHKNSYVPIQVRAATRSDNRDAFQQKEMRQMLEDFPVSGVTAGNSIPHPSLETNRGTALSSGIPPLRATVELQETCHAYRRRCCAKPAR